MPSAELSGAQDVTKGLGDPIRYGYHDAVLRQMIEYRHHLIDFFEWMLEGKFFERIGWNGSIGTLDDFAGAEEWVEDLEWIDRQLRVNYFKRIQAPPIIVVSKRAFGFDLRGVAGAGVSASPLRGPARRGGPNRLQGRAPARRRLSARAAAVPPRLRRPAAAPKRRTVS